MARGGAFAAAVPLRDPDSPVHSHPISMNTRSLGRQFAVICRLPSRVPGLLLTRIGRLSCAIALTLLSLGGLAPASAQTPATGSVEGRVKNQVSGENLYNARVAVKGTNIMAFTDGSGLYRLNDLPGGPVTLRVFFTGLDEQEVKVDITPRLTVTQDIGLTSKARYGADSDTVKLDAFTVQSTRETNAGAIAVNEQRVATNIKSVVSTSEFGTIPDDNPGEFLKWLPGVGVEYFANNITGVNVRGLGAVNTEINFDGMPIASANADGTSRQFELKGASAADIARVEVRKLPLPEDSANSIGGSINFIRRTAFEFSRRRISYDAHFTTDGEKLTLADREGPKDRKQQYWRPNWKIDWVEPLTKDLGFVFTMGQTNQIVRTHWNNPTWSYGSAAQLAQAQADSAAGKPLTTVSLLNPAMTAMLLHDAPIEDNRDNVSLRFDWRPVRTLTLGYSIGYTRYYNQTADDIRYTWTSTATGSGDPQFVDRRTMIGRAGGGAIYYNTPLWRDLNSPTTVHIFESQWKEGAWTATAKGTFSMSRSWINSGNHGFFNSIDGGGIAHTGVGFGTANPLSITTVFKDVDLRGPREIYAFTTPDGKAGAANTYTVPVDWQSASTMRIGGGVDRPGRSKADVLGGKVSLRREFNFVNHLALQAGLDYTEEYRNRRYAMNVYQFVGPDHIAASADDSASQIAAVALTRDRDPFSQLPPIDHVSLSRLYSIYQAHPDYFVYDQNQSLRNTVTNSYDFTEKTTAPYLEFFQNLMENRLRISGGVRFERQETAGNGYFLDQSAAYQKYSNGVVKHAGDTVGSNGLPTKTSGAPVFLPGVTSGSLAEALLVLKDKGAHGSGSNSNYFPSLNANYNITPNLILQFGYAKVQAKNQLTRTVIPNNTVSDTVQPDGSLGLVSMRNPELKPWISYSEDLRLMYYTDSGGAIGAGVFRKSIHNWQVSTTDLLATTADTAAFGLSDQYVGYDVNALFNNGNARIDGAELELRQSLNPIFPKWAQGFSVSGTYTYTNLKGQPASSDLGSVYDYRGTVYLRYNRRKLELNFGWARNGPNANGVVSTAGVTGAQVQRSQDLIDLGAAYAVTKWAQIFFSGRNVHGAWRLREARYPGAPSYATLNSSNNIGVTYTLGVKGSF